MIEILTEFITLFEDCKDFDEALYFVHLHLGVSEEMARRTVIDVLKKAVGHA